MNEKNFYINIPNSLGAKTWINTKKAEKEIKNVGDNEVIEAIFDPLETDLVLAYRIELRENQVNKYRAVLEGLGADFSENPSEYRRKFPPKNDITIDYPL